MKRIGFIDYYIDEGHARRLPNYIRQSPFGDQFQLALAWEQTSPPGKMPIDQWCELHNVGKADSMQQVVDECDCLLVLSPDHADKHEALSQLALSSGKPVFVDKPFALDCAAAQRMFDLAARHNTPMYSSSALRFAPALKDALAGTLNGQRVNFMATRSPQVFSIYAVHHLEMIAMVMGGDAERVIYTGNEWCSALTIDFGDGRRAQMNTIPGHPYELVAYFGQENEQEKLVRLENISNFMECAVDAMLSFFLTGEPPVEPDQTMQVIALLEAGLQAADRPDEWVSVPR